MPIRPSNKPSELTKLRAKQLRAKATEPEKILWSALRGRKLDGLKFRRQHPIEPNIVDFYCAKACMAVELDGQSHDDRIDYDAERTRFLEALGLHVLRISNDNVLNNLDGVCESIYNAVIARLSASKRPR